MINIILFLLIVLILLLLLNTSSKESFEIKPRPIPDVGIPLANLNISSYNFQDKMTPIRFPMTEIVAFPYLDRKSYVDPNTVFDIEEWKSLISKINMKIPHTYQSRHSKDEVSAMTTNSYSAIMKTLKKEVTIVDYGFTELEGVDYRYFNDINRNNIDTRWIENMKKQVLSDVSEEFSKASMKLTQCQSSYNPCNLEITDWRILKLGVNKDTNFKIIEGQLLLSVINRPLLILLHYISSDESGYTLYTIYVEGLKDRADTQYQSQESTIMAYEGFINPPTNLLKLYPNPIVSDDVDISSYGTLIEPDYKYAKMVVDNNLQEQENMNETRCFGKLAMTKSECEAVIDPAGQPFKSIGVWDKECRKDEECPFYKANKNYPNSFGGCISGKCQMPYGITQISPLQYRDEENASCFGCKYKGVKCCNEQKDRNLYPNLKSPDYKFEGDELYREKYYYMLPKYF
jgi:hypothetical protein